MKISSLSLSAILLSLLVISANGVAQKSVAKKNKTFERPKKKNIKYGLASYYAKKFSGRTTSDGSKYDAQNLTGACNVLPLGTWVKVTNLKNRRSVVVQINDRLHHKNHRLIDLSKSAAKKLGYILRGVTRVKVEVLSNRKRKQV